MNEILVRLLSNRVIRRGKYSWQWAEKSSNNPSLRNKVTSKLFRAYLVEEVDAEMKLTSLGKLFAEKLQRD